MNGLEGHDVLEAKFRGQKKTISKADRTDLEQCLHGKWRYSLHLGRLQNFRQMRICLKTTSLRVS